MLRYRNKHFLIYVLSKCYYVERDWLVSLLHLRMSQKHFSDSEFLQILKHSLQSEFEKIPEIFLSDIPIILYCICYFFQVDSVVYLESLDGQGLVSSHGLLHTLPREGLTK